MHAWWPAEQRAWQGGASAAPSGVHLPPPRPPLRQALAPCAACHAAGVRAEGRICLDILNMPPKGAWKPSLNVPTVLASIGLLLAEPNPEDGLVTDVVRYRSRRA